MVFHHPAHTLSIVVRDFFVKHSTTIIPQAPYSPDNTV